MAQHDYDINSSDAISGLQFRQDVNNVLSAIKSSNSGATSPTTYIAGTLWLDTSTTPHILKKRNTANNGWDTIRIEDALGTAIPSATTTTVGTYSGGNTVHITGVTTITSLGVSTTGTTRTLIFDGALTITHNATSLILLGGVDILTVAGSIANFVCEDGALGYWRCTAISHSAVSMAELLYISTLTSDAQTQLNTKAPLSSPTFTGTPTAPTASLGTNTTQIATTAFVLANAVGSVSGVRQTVQSGSVDTSGIANFLSIGTGLNVNIAATTTPLVIHAAGGAISGDRLGIVSADTTLLLPANGTRYIYADISSLGVVTFFSSALQPIFQMGGTPSVTSGQNTFNIGEMKSYRGNGATAPQIWTTFIGEAVTDATTVTSVTNYAINGFSFSEQTSLAVGSLYSKNHNIGNSFVNHAVFLECTTANLNYSIGDRIPVAYGNTSAGSATNYSVVQGGTRLTTFASTGSSGIFLMNKTTGVADVPAVLSSWKLIFNPKRTW